MSQKVLKIRLTLMGRPMKSYTFDKDVITVGRDPEADIFLDNAGISREHMRLERQASGDYMLVDLGSANGTYVNDDRAQKKLVRDQDVVRIGKFSLWIGIADDRRTIGPTPRQVTPDTYQATMVLSSSEMDVMMNRAREREVKGAQEAPTVPAAPRPRVLVSNVTAVLIAWLAGVAVGAGTFWWLLKG